MRKIQIHKLVQESYIKNTLDLKKVEQIAKFLKRSHLKKYIRSIKSFEKKLSIIISLPLVPNEKEKEKLKNLFPNKKIIYQIDPTLIAGIRMTQEDDWIYEFSLKSSLENLIKRIEQN